MTIANLADYGCTAGQDVASVSANGVAIQEAVAAVGRFGTIMVPPFPIWLPGPVAPPYPITIQGEGSPLGRGTVPDVGSMLRFADPTQPGIQIPQKGADGMQLIKCCFQGGLHTIDFGTGDIDNILFDHIVVIEGARANVRTAARIEMSEFNGLVSVLYGTTGVHFLAEENGETDHYKQSYVADCVFKRLVFWGGDLGWYVNQTVGHAWMGVRVFGLRFAQINRYAMAHRSQIVSLRFWEVGDEFCGGGLPSPISAIFDFTDLGNPGVELINSQLNHACAAKGIVKIIDPAYPCTPTDLGLAFPTIQ